MNKQKLLELADFIEYAPPEKFYMADWMVRNYKRGPVCLTEVLEDSCGTACCIGGWAALREGFCLDQSAVYDKDSHYLGSVDSIVVGLFDLPNHDLFFVEDWPFEFRVEYEVSEQKDRNKIAARVIRDYVAKEGWTIIEENTE